MSVKSIFNDLQTKINANPDGIKGSNTVYQFELLDDETYQVKFADDRMDISEELIYEPACTLQLSSDNFVKLVNGDLNPQMAFMMGKLKIIGNIGLGLKLHAILQYYKN